MNLFWERNLDDTRQALLPPRPSLMVCLPQMGLMARFAHLSLLHRPLFSCCGIFSERLRRKHDGKELVPHSSNEKNVWDLVDTEKSQQIKEESVTQP